MEEKIVLCGANAYDKKYYFNQKFDRIPDSIKDELHIICVLFTEEVGGIITLAFDEEGTLVIEEEKPEEAVEEVAEEVIETAEETTEE